MKLTAYFLKICGLIILKRKAIFIRENEVRFLNVIFPFQVQLPEIKTEFLLLPVNQGFGKKQLREALSLGDSPRIKKKMLRTQLYCVI